MCTCPPCSHNSVKKEVSKMAHLHKKVKKDHTYYYIRESQRIKGRPTIVNQVYLGTADKVQSLLDFPEGHSARRFFAQRIWFGISDQRIGPGY